MAFYGEPGSQEIPPTRPALSTELLPGSAQPVPEPPPRRRQGCQLSTLVLIVVAAGFVCLLAAGILLMIGYTTGSLPSQVAVLLTPRITTPPELPPRPSNVPSPVPTVQPVTETPAIGVTPLFTESPPPDDSATPTPTLQVDTESGELVQGGAIMVRVEGGTFTMGSLASGRERPPHAVTLDAYYIDRFEVTNAQYRACVEAGACTPPASTLAYDGSPYYNDPAFDRYPVIFVSWQQAATFCSWRGARLPTEAEWEMAARWDPETGEVRAYPWGDEADPTRLNFCDASCLLGPGHSYDDGWPQMAEVGSFPEGASPVGAMDMAGNVAEWVADWFDAGYYSISPAENPTGPSTGTLRVVRGGAWGVGLEDTRSAARSAFDPSLQIAGIGFRCAISADAIQGEQP